MEDLDTIQLQHDYQNMIVRVGLSLALKVLAHLEDFLIAQSKVFAWSHEHMSGIDLEVIVHQLNMNTSHNPIRRKKVLQSKKIQGNKRRGGKNFESQLH